MIVKVIITVSLMTMIRAEQITFDDVVIETKSHYQIEIKENVAMRRGIWHIVLVLRDMLPELDALRERMKRAATELYEWVRTDMHCRDQIEVFVTSRNERVGVVPCSPDDRHNLRRQLDFIRQENFRFQTRQRRGIIDGIGKVSKYLFGTATTEDVTLLNQLIMQGRQKTKTIDHDIKRLVTIVDHAVQDINDTRYDLRQSLAVQRQLEAKLKETRVALNTHAQVASTKYYAQTLVDLHDKLNFIELEHENNLRDASSGRINRKIITPTIYNEVVNAALERGLKVPNFQWLRHYGKIEYFAYESNQYIYDLEVPFVEDEAYQLFKLEPIPFLYNNSLVELELERLLLYCTSTGAVARPANCVGHNPTICDPVTRWTSDTFTCEKGIISHHKDSLETCTLNVLELPMTLTITQSRLIMTSQILNMACEGQTPLVRTYNDGVYDLQLPGNCVLSGQGWTLPGQTVLFGQTRVVEEDVVDIDLPAPQFDAPLRDINDSDINDALDNMEQRLQRTEERRANDRKELQELAEAHVNLDPYYPSLHVDAGHSALLALLVISTIVTLSLCCCYRKKLLYVLGPLCKKKKQTNEVAKPTTPEVAVELGRIQE